MQLQCVGLGAIQARAHSLNDYDADGVFPLGEVCAESIVALHAGPHRVRSWLSRLGIGSGFLVSDMGALGPCNGGQMGICAGKPEAAALAPADYIQGTG